jgi:hypothetical protein
MLSSSRWDNAFRRRALVIERSGTAIDGADVSMRRYFLFLALACLPPLPAFAATGLCSDDNDRSASIITNERGEILDLAVTIGDSAIVRYPEANGKTLTLPAHQFTFAAKKAGKREAVQLDLNGKQGKLTFRGKTSVLECEWQ